MKRWAILSLLFLACSVHGQLNIPVPFILDGTEAAARQVTGLGYPVHSTAGVSLETARARGPITGVSNGQAVLTIELSPPVGAIPVGMELTVFPTESNVAGAQITVNGLGPYALIKWGGLPLDSAELPVGVPARMVFDGSQFHLLSDAGRPCPVGYTAASNIHCIQDSSMAAANFRNAANSCSLSGGRLCSMQEWVMGCHRLPGFLASVSTLEWVDHATNSSAQGKLMGIDRVTQVLGCDFGDTSDQSNLHRYRCCTTR